VHYGAAANYSIKADTDWLVRWTAVASVFSNGLQYLMKGYVLVQEYNNGRECDSHILIVVVRQSVCLSIVIL
jgi:hypothetical protein